MEDNTHPNWNTQLENILSSEGEKANCFYWLHSKSEKQYSSFATYITIPTVILSTVAGSASIGSQSMFENSTLAPLIIGGVSLLVGVLNTVSSYFNWAKRSENHRLSALNYAKIYRFILIELSLPRNERIVAKDMLKFVRSELDRLQENSPQIPDTVIKQFRNTFGKTTPEVSKPEITNGLDPIYVYTEEKVKPLLPLQI